MTQATPTPEQIEKFTERFFGTDPTEDYVKAMRREFLTIKALDDDAALLYSNQTDQWYVSASIHIVDGQLTRSVSEHRDTPWEAIQAYLHALMEVDGLKARIHTGKYGQERSWVWNGAAWRELPES